LPRFAHPIGTFDPDQVPYLVEAGREETEAALPYIRRLLAEPVATP
jgi:hypothetical protein